MEKTTPRAPGSEGIRSPAEKTAPVPLSSLGKTAQHRGVRPSSSEIILWQTISTPCGLWRVAFSESGLLRLWPEDAPQPANLKTRGSLATMREAPLPREWHDALLRWLPGNASPGAIATWETLPPLAPCGTAFQRTVWSGLLTIPVGTVLTYGELARRVGHPCAVRAVAAACGANPWPLLVPCHRVVAANRHPGGYRWGLPVKLRLLYGEGVLLREGGGCRKQLRLFPVQL